MAYKGDTVKFRVSSPNGTYRTVSTREEAEQAIKTLVDTYAVAWAAVDRIETTRILVRQVKTEE
jgi:hypothetical protein